MVKTLSPKKGGEEIKGWTGEREGEEGREGTAKDRRTGMWTLKSEKSTKQFLQCGPVNTSQTRGT